MQVYFQLHNSSFNGNTTCALFEWCKSWLSIFVSNQFFFILFYFYDLSLTYDSIMPSMLRKLYLVLFQIYLTGLPGCLLKADVSPQESSEYYLNQTITPKGRNRFEFLCDLLGTYVWSTHTPILRRILCFFIQNQRNFADLRTRACIEECFTTYLDATILAESKQMVSTIYPQNFL